MACRARDGGGVGGDPEPDGGLVVDASETAPPRPTGRFEPLRQRTFRTIWTASLLSNFGQLILGVGAAWEMTRLTHDPRMVALVQTALMLPLMLVAVPAGAFADMFDRRKIAMLGLVFAVLSSAMLAAFAFLDMTTPWIMLGFCSLIGAGVALYAPAWQASIGEQVEPEQLPAAVALGTISYNLARSFGPALGGVIVLAAGAQAAFAVNAVGYIPLLIAFFLWKRRHMPSRLPPERVDRAIVSGARYALHSPSVRKVLVRIFSFGLSGASSAALGPLIASDLLGGDASTFGLLLGAGGVGAVFGALLVSELREKLGTENVVRLCAVIAAAAIFATGFSHNLLITCTLMFIAGGTNMLMIAMLNVSVQMAVPRWVTARALSLFSSALTGGIAIGSIIWGWVAAAKGVDIALMASGGALLLTPLIGLLFPLNEASQEGVELAEIGNEPQVNLDLNLRSGPVTIEVDYRIDPANAREYYDAMRKVQRMRLRNGGFNWSISRDVANPENWTETFHCPTWGDYLRMRHRFTEADREAQAAAVAFMIDGETIRVRRRLERPYGSVRWQAGTPDPKQVDVGVMVP
jgi:MFS family permease